MGRRVAITGTGVVSAAGNDLVTFWDTLMRGECRLRPLENFHVKDFESLLGGEVELAADDALPANVDPNADRARCLSLALAATKRALAQAALPSDGHMRTGVVMGTTMGEERQVAHLSDHGPDAGFFGRATNQRLSTVIAEQHGFGGPAMIAAGACSSGNAAIATAYDLIRAGEADVMIAGAADTFVRSIFCGFFRMNAMSKGICRPYDRNRDGVTFGEGAGVIVLEDYERAEARGARILAEIVGFGVSNDAHHVTAPDPSGAGFARAIRQALRTTNTAPDAVDYVSAHGTGTAYSDLCEVRALHDVFGERGRTLPISSIKSMIGHTNGAASAIEAVACVLAFEHGAVPPTANLLEQDPECAIDCVPGKGRALDVGTILSLSAGFGGFNVCLVLRRAA